MTDYKPGQRVHVKTPLGSFNVDEGGTYVAANLPGYEFIHLIDLDSGKRLQFRDHEVSPAAEVITLIENAEWADAINAMGDEVPNDKSRRYTITFEESK